MKTGRDEWGEWMPLHFKSYGEYKLPGQIYASIPGIAIFGLNEFGVRITPVVYGSLTILIVFLLARSLFASNKIGLLSALFVAVSPWHIQLTRGSFESSFALFWVLLGLWFWVEGAVKLRWLWLVTVLCFVLADDKRMDHINSFEELGAHWEKETEHYFEHYKDLKKPGTCKVLGFFGKDEAIKIIRECQERYKNHAAYRTFDII
jgi:hypothetical protein